MHRLKRIQTMRKFLSIIAATGMLLTTSVIAFADDKKVVQNFYDYLSNPGSEKHAQIFRNSVSPDWKSIGNYSGKNKSADKFVGQLGGFAKLIPNLNWNVEEMIQAGNRMIVRSKATGTPVGPLFGVDGKGKSFTIMTIDIHTLENGKIVKTYHIEDWAGALRQLQTK